MWVRMTWLILKCTCNKYLKIRVLSLLLQLLLLIHSNCIIAVSYISPFILNRYTAQQYRGTHTHTPDAPCEDTSPVPNIHETCNSVPTPLTVKTCAAWPICENITILLYFSRDCYSAVSIIS